MDIHDKLNVLQSCIVNTVHDSIVIDVHPDEIQKVIDIIKDVNNYIDSLIMKEFKVTINVPLLLEAKIGNNWLDTKDVI